MARLTLFSPTPPDLSAFGVRSLQATLKAAGHDVRLVLFPGSIGLLQEDGSFVYRYPERVVDQALELARDSDLIGVSFFTNYYDRAVQLTEAVRARLTVPVIWGGIHATVRPVEALNHADFVCRGEGETALSQLLAALDAGGATDAVAGVWTRRAGAVVDNGLAPLVADLDALPFFDFSGVDQYVYAPEARGIVPLTADILARTLPRVPSRTGRLLRVYRTMTDRGCPHGCAYCNVPTVKELFRGGPVPYFRNRGVPHVMAELRAVLARYPFIEGVQLFDDTFFSRRLDWLEAFAAAYKKDVGLPLYCQASPTTLEARKLDVLLDAGLCYVEMGIQTGSPAMRRRFRRPETDDTVLAGARLLHDRRDRLLPPDYHVILDAPWETFEDRLDTVRLLARLPKPFGLAIASLVYFPETELYRQAKAEGRIHDEETEIYRRPFYIPPRRDYPSFLLYLLTFQRIPKALYAALLSPGVVRFFTRANPVWLYRLAYPLGEAARLAAKGATALAGGDFSRIIGYFRRLVRRDPVAAGRKG
ncbi:B12-binding domain-containing radical SAM protein [Solidesulfovibrio sp.]|uniref:B12-binding domain-containing radical SAM protein n=1 Tax=Solidesulfovibrio sp. TaxID=2910990 RepID=UPI002B21E560|nr:radical SAM protein [Solidesulfovibrio sp.]MEA4855579.1 radical SAM protein [Solidesulfovibrio sp.]